MYGSWQPMSQWGQQNFGPGLMNPQTMGVTPSTTSSNAGGGFFYRGNSNFGWNANTLNFGLQGLQGLGSLWGAWQSNRLARDQLDFTKNFARANLANQTQSYNTAIEDRARSRAAAEGQTSAEQAAYVNRNRLPDRNI